MNLRNEKLKKFNLLIALIFALNYSSFVLAAQTDSQYFTAPLALTQNVTTNGGNITATINVSTGALSSSFTPGFTMNTNGGAAQSLTMTATANSQGGSQNAIFNISTTKYIILSNSTVSPPVSSFTDIKSGSPTAANNPNAIAYVINDPATVPARLTVSYNILGKYWDLVLTHNGNTNTSITVPANTPLANTYSFDDEPGNYQATITLSFI
jgi:hypothetical protein